MRPVEYIVEDTLIFGFKVIKLVDGQNFDFFEICNSQLLFFGVFSDYVYFLAGPFRIEVTISKEVVEKRTGLLRIFSFSCQKV